MNHGNAFCSEREIITHDPQCPELRTVVSEATECLFSVSLRDIPNDSTGLAAVVRIVSDWEWM